MVRVRIRVRIRFSVWLVSGYAHMCLLLSVVIAILPWVGRKGRIQKKVEGIGLFLK